MDMIQPNNNRSILLKIKENFLSGLILIGLIFLGVGCFWASKPTQTISLLYRPEELKELPPAHDIHRGKLPGSCSDCHYGKGARINPNIPSMSACMTCHTGGTAPVLGCQSCHLGTAKIFQGVGGAGLAAISAAMQKIDCNVCHDPKDDYKVPPGGCISCHANPNRGDKIGLQKNYQSRLSNLEYLLNTYVQTGGNTTSMEFKAAEYNYFLARLDRSRGVHNASFVNQLITEAERLLGAPNNRSMAPSPALRY